MLTQERLKELLTYNPITGVFTWKPRKGEKSFNTRLAGREAGSVQNRGNGRKGVRIKIRVNNKFHFAHRLVWLYVYGKFPDNEIDHINGNPLDNRLCNLRDVDRALNCRNLTIRTHNKSGLHGVWFSKKSGRYVVRIGDNHPTRKGSKFIGSYLNFFDACCARKSAELKYNYHPNHGRY